LKWDRWSYFTIFVSNNVTDIKWRMGQLGKLVLHWSSDVKNGGEHSTVFCIYDLITLAPSGFELYYYYLSAILKIFDFIFIFYYDMLSNVKFILCVVTYYFAHM
jgi:hypothetical protein